MSLALTLVTNCYKAETSVTGVFPIMDTCQKTADIINRRYLMNTFSKITIGVVTTLGLVVGVGAYAGKHYGHSMKGEFMIYKLEKELDLSTEQVDRLKSIQSYMKAKHESHDHSAGKAKLVEMLKSPQLDQAQVLAIMDEKMQNMRNQAPEMLSKIADFTDNLNAEQRAELLEMIESFSGRMGKHKGH